MGDEGEKESIVDKWYATTRACLDEETVGFDDAVWARLETLITTAVRQVERETWEKAAARIDSYNDDMGHFDPELQRIVEWMRQRAKDKP